MTDWAGKRAAYAGQYDIVFSAGSEESAATQQVTVEKTVVLGQLPKPHYP